MTLGARIFLLLQAVLFGLFAWQIVTDPIGYVGGWGMEVSGRHGAYELIGIYGGVSIGFALLCLLAVFRSVLIRPALIALVTYHGGYLIGRGLGVAVDGMPEQSYLTFIIIETVSFALAGLLLALVPRRQSA